jgi:hypothetical protein
MIVSLLTAECSNDLHESLSVQEVQSKTVVIRYRRSLFLLCMEYLPTAVQLTSESVLAWLSGPPFRCTYPDLD